MMNQRAFPWFMQRQTRYCAEIQEICFLSGILVTLSLKTIGPSFNLCHNGRFFNIEASWMVVRDSPG